MRKEKSINKSNSRINNIKKFFILADSRKYQRMLAGVRIYFSLMTQRSFINFMILLLFMMGFAFTVFSLAVFYNRLPMSPFIFMMPLIYVFIPMILFVFIIQYREFGFKLLKGYSISLRNPKFLVFTIPILIIVIISIFSAETIEIKVFMGGYFFIIQLIIILLQMGSLETSSLILYAKEKLDDTINIKTEKETRSLTSKFELFYYSIYTYYRKLLREIKARYKDDVLLYFQLDKIPMLASQIHTKDVDKREKINNILTKLEQVTPFEKPDEYIKIMEDINKSYRESLSLPNDAMIIQNLFREKSTLKKIKFYLIALIPIISIIVNIYLNYLA